MKQVDFYLLRNATNQGRLKFASRLAKKLQSLDQKSLIVLGSESEVAELDALLWSFSDTSFVAHDSISSAARSLSKTHLAQHSEVDNEGLVTNYDVLINLSPDVPIFSAKFSRIAEVIEADENAKAAGRTRFKHYKTAGFEVKTHDIEL